MTKTCRECQDRLLDLLEGELEGDDAAQVRAHLDSCGECRGEYLWLSTTTSDLSALGDELANTAPQIDLVAAVLRAAAMEDRRAQTQAYFQRRQARFGRWAALTGAALAAAAAVILWFGWNGPSSPSSPVPPTPRPPQVANNQRLVPVLPPPIDVRGDLRNVRERLAHETTPLTRQRPPAPEKLQAVTASDIRSVTFNEVVQARRKAIENEEARAQLVRWASFTPEEARRVLEREDLSIPAVVGLAESLDANEAAPLLLAAVGQYPDDPYLRFALASKAAAPASASYQPINPLAPDPEIPPETISPATREWIDAWRAVDPENALPYYVEAEMLLAGGDLPGALEALRLANELDTADVYALEGAAAREQALVAGGMPPDTAHLLVALTAGNDEYNFLYSLSEDLLGYGRTYAEQNYAPEAQQIFAAVERLGEQVQTGAEFSLVESAGLSIQQQALTSLESFYAAFSSEEAAQQFRADAEELLVQAEELNRYIEQLNALFASEDLLWDVVADAILQGGDLNLLDYLYQANR